MLAWTFIVHYCYYFTHLPNTPLREKISCPLQMRKLMLVYMSKTRFNANFDLALFVFHTRSSKVLLFLFGFWCVSLFCLKILGF